MIRYPCARILSSIALLGVLIAVPMAVRATPSGLNNIPTADTAPDLVPVVQVFSTFGSERKPDHSAGLKIGLGPWNDALLGSRFEFGVDGRYAPDPEGPAVFQMKYALQPWERGPALAIGMANLAVTDSDRERGGQPFSYAVLSHDFRWFRLHGGYGIQHEGNAGFVGIDRTFDLCGKPLTLRADATQIQDEEQWMASVGAMLVLHRYVVLETWGSFPVETGEPTFTLKLNFVFDWKRR